MASSPRAIAGETIVRILFVTGGMPWQPGMGGGHLIAYELARHLSQVSCKVDYLSVVPAGQERLLPWAQRVCYVMPTNSLIFPWQLYWAARSLKGYDIVHAHGPEGVGFGLGRHVGRPSALVMSSYLAAFVPGQGKMQQVWRFYEGIALRRADRVFALSEFARSGLSQFYNVPLDRITTIYAGVSAEFLDRVANHQPFQSQRPVLLLVGRLEPQKGIDVLLRALSLMNQYQITLRIVGYGPYEAEYQALARTLGLSERVEFTGFVAPEAMPEVYCAADLFVLPSRGESFGLVLAEAMAANLPVVASRTGAIPEVIEDGQTGILVPPDDPSALAQALDSILTDPSRSRAMGMTGRARVEAKFTWPRIADRVAELYEQVLSLARKQ